MRTATAGRIRSRVVALVTVVLAAIMISACSGGALRNAFSRSNSGGASSSLAPVSFSNIIGPPKNVGDQLTAQLINEAQRKNIPVVTEKGKPSTYTIQGYFAQSNERTSEKFSYILDVTDKSGLRVHRILGEEAVPAQPGAKPWTSINQAALQKIAAKTTSDLATWLTKQGGSATPASAPPAPPVARATPKTETPAPSTPARTASTSRRSQNIAALVPPVSGAPGDGRTSLTSALRERLKARGVHIATTGGNDVYRINGKVTLGPAPGSNQRVQIVWRIMSPAGTDLGTVTQQSDVPKGSLDKSWGPAALSAGNAAASEIVNLIEKNRK